MEYLKTIEEEKNSAVSTQDKCQKQEDRCRGTSIWKLGPVRAG